MQRFRPSRKPVEHTAAELRPRNELDAMIANIELTLISIVQGVALYFLTDSARASIAELRWASLPYVLSGAALILTVWTRSLIHALTVIRWPLELGHNFFYIVVTLFEATLFTQLSTPARWYPISVLLGLIFWTMFAYERRLYRMRRQDSAGPHGAALLEVLEADHELSLRVLIPLSVLSWGGYAALVARYPQQFLDHGWHVALASLQALGILGYLALVWRFYRGITAKILAARAEWEA